MCGIIGMISRDDVIKPLALGMLAQQHRGKESAGVALLNSGREMVIFRKMGFVNELFQEYDLMGGKYDTHAAIGHIRYGTTGNSTIKNAHPIYGKCKFGRIAIVHNGNITNLASLQARCNESHTLINQTETDTEIILHLIARSQETTLDKALIDAVRQLEGAFSFLLLSKHALYAVRDQREFRGLVIGCTESSYVFASETVAIDAAGATFVREVAAGEIIKIGLVNLEAETIMLWGMDTPPLARCAFELVYLQSPASTRTNTRSEDIYSVRQRFGMKLAECFLDKYYNRIRQDLFVPLPDMVIPVPDSGNQAALGFANMSKIPFEPCLIRDHYSSRTFLSPKQKHREYGVRTKFHPSPHLLAGKRIIIVDDSLVRGTTLRWVVSELLKKQCFVKEVHVCIAAPPIRHPCFYGVDMKSYDELIAAQKKEAEICDFIGADSLTYLPVESFKKILGDSYCMACFNGDYPVQV
ncbi:MAG: amidophosphoribosyltransferase [Parcubacteria group bacterium]|nr:amidophosphoribosyltransferase [Parcubacteria group bacterium]